MTNLAANTSFNAKINEVKKEIPNIAILATITFLLLLKIKYRILVI